MKLTHLTLKLFWLLLLAVPVLAQGGGGDLPPVPKATTTKSKAKPTTSKTKTPPSKTPPKILIAKEPAQVDEIAFNELAEGKIEAQTAGRIPPNIYYQEFSFAGTDADLFEVQVNSLQAALKVELYDANKINVPLKRDEQSGLYRLNTDGFVLPADGTYRVRVSVAPSPTLAAPIPFTVKLIHNGLTAAGYQFRLQQIVKGFSPQKPDESIAQLERLTQDDPKKPGAFEYLGLLYNEFKKDQAKASAAMLQAITLGGAAIFKVAHDSQWRRPQRDRKTQRFAFQELRTNWLRISATQLAVTDFNIPDKALLALTREQLKEVSRVPPSAFFFIKHNNKKIKPDTITFGVPTPVEADLIVDLIKGNLIRN
jgi:hypothetical protein